MPKWINSKWKRADLEKKKVEFEVPLDGHIQYGRGEFWVVESPEGQLSIEIVIDTQGRDWAERVQKRFHLTEQMEERIVRHPDPKVADFLLK